ncbi:MAG: hypothetical protein BGO69_02850 [Bacteroidetes bacterium 46-16]|nr:MAG: hypothetical protein BGO69_02850 [Bacteroidetes bacterium 46-16]
MDLLRFTTAGSVDDGKSTLIGRLLYDTGNIKTDILETLTMEGGLNLAHVTDGLRAERQQKITIDVAYKYFSTPHRKFIITDAPGHFEYTRNLVTGASNVDVMIILIDAKNGITAQTRRHSMVASFLQVGKLVVAINKMDLHDYAQQVYERIKDEYLQMADKLGLHNITFIPMSALHGDNVTTLSAKTPWYIGPALLELLESYKIPTQQYAHLRLSIQYAIEDGQQGYAGKILSGTLHAGDKVLIMPSGRETVISSISHNYDTVGEAHAPANVCVYTDGTSLSRGDILSHPQDKPLEGQAFETALCWMDAVTALDTGKTYLLRINTAEAGCMVTSVLHKINIDTLENYSDEAPLEANQFATVQLRTHKPIAWDHFITLAENARGILIDPDTNNTVAAFMIR